MSQYTDIPSAAILSDRAAQEGKAQSWARRPGAANVTARQPSTAMDDMVRRIHQLREEQAARLYASTNVLEEYADRMFGVQPETASGYGLAEDDSPEGSWAQLCRAVGMLEASLNEKAERLATAVARTTQIA